MTPEHIEQNKAIFEQIDRRFDQVDAKIDMLTTTKMDKPPTTMFVTVIIAVIAQAFALGATYNKVDLAVADRYTSVDAARDLALVDIRFTNVENEVLSLERIQEQFRLRIRELETKHNSSSSSSSSVE